MKLEHHSGSARVLVSDNAERIPVEAQRHLFDRFFRVDGSRSRSVDDIEGAGLGLSIARWIAEIHHGEVFLQSSGDEGNVFAIVLPTPEA